MLGKCFSKRALVIPAISGKSPKLVMLEAKNAMLGSLVVAGGVNAVTLFVDGAGIGVSACILSWEVGMRFPKRGVG